MLKKFNQFALMFYIESMEIFVLQKFKTVVNRNS